MKNPSRIVGSILSIVTQGKSLLSQVIKESQHVPLLWVQSGYTLKYDNSIVQVGDRLVFEGLSVGC
jgi:hypothetical protein